MKLIGRTWNLPHKCGNLHNHDFTYGNDIYWTFLIYVRTTKSLVIITILSNKNHNVINGDFINVNAISTYDQVYDSNGEHAKLSTLITI